MAKSEGSIPPIHPQPSNRIAFHEWRDDLLLREYLYARPDPNARARRFLERVVETLPPYNLLAEEASFMLSHCDGECDKLAPISRNIQIFLARTGFKIDHHYTMCQAASRLRSGMAKSFQEEIDSYLDQPLPGVSRSGPPS